MDSAQSMRTGRIVVVSGPSGVGKSTVCRRLCAMLPARFSVSVTTRPPRPGEQNDRDYRYVDPDEFARLRDAGELVEWAEVYGHWYGTPSSPIKETIRRGELIILEIDIKGCIQVRKAFPDSLCFFLLPPTPAEQKRRIEGRNTDQAEAIRQRLSQADGEIRYASESGCYDAFIINDNLDETVDRMYKTIVAEAGRTPGDEPSEG